jgi:hypothetical protein
MALLFTTPPSFMTDRLSGVPQTRLILSRFLKQRSQEVEVNKKFKHYSTSNRLWKTSIPFPLLAERKSENCLYGVKQMHASLKTADKLRNKHLPFKVSNQPPSTAFDR